MNFFEELTVRYGDDVVVSSALSSWAKEDFVDLNGWIGGRPVQHVDKWDSVDEGQLSFVMLPHCLILRLDDMLCSGPRPPRFAVVKYDWFRAKLSRFGNGIVVDYLNNALALLDDGKWHTTRAGKVLAR